MVSGKIPIARQLFVFINMAVNSIVKVEALFSAALFKQNTKQEDLYIVNIQVSLMSDCIQTEEKLHIECQTRKR